MTGASTTRRWRTGIIGHTSLGNYAQDLDLACGGIPELDVAAVADPDPQGRARAGLRAGAPGTYADYRTMLAAAEVDLVVITPRRVDERRPCSKR